MDNLIKKNFAKDRVGTPVKRWEKPFLGPEDSPIKDDPHK
jgi:hypothetical protein